MGLVSNFVYVFRVFTRHMYSHVLRQQSFFLSLSFLFSREYEDVKECVSEFSHTCDVINQASVIGRDDAYQWLCEDGFEGLILTPDRLP